MDTLRQELAAAKIIHEAKIGLCWGNNFIGKRDPWPDFDDPKILRAYPHDPISYVDIALKQVRALVGAGIIGRLSL